MKKNILISLVITVIIVLLGAYGLSVYVESSRNVTARIPVPTPLLARTPDTIQTSPLPSPTFVPSTPTPLVVPPTHVPSLTPTPTRGIVSLNFDWQIYRNDKYGFELSRPKQWTLSEIEGNAPLFIVHFSSPDNLYSYDVQVLTNSSGLTLEQLKTGTFIGYTKIYGQDAVQIKDVPSDPNTISTYTIRNGNIYRISYVNGNPQTNPDIDLTPLTAAYTTLLNSFRFLN